MLNFRIEKGHAEAASAGALLAEENFRFDVAYTSYLQRAIRTLWHALEQTDHMHIPVTTAWQLNERHYGALQGLDKKATVDKYGTEQVNIWRRSYDIPPPGSRIVFNAFNLPFQLLQTADRSCFNYDFFLTLSECGTDSTHYPGNIPKYATLAGANKITAESLKVH